MSEFRKFVRLKVDNNKNADKETKKKFEQQLDYLILCKKVFDTPESDVDVKVTLMVEVVLHTGKVLRPKI